MSDAEQTVSGDRPSVRLDRSTQVEHSMGINKDQVEGRAKVVSGRVTAAAGVVVGSDRLELKGTAQEAVGKAQAKFGDVKERVKSSLKGPT